MNLPNGILAISLGTTRQSSTYPSVIQTRWANRRIKHHMDSHHKIATTTVLMSLDNTAMNEFPLSNPGL